MKNIKINAILVLGVLFGAFTFQKAEDETLMTADIELKTIDKPCLSLAQDKFTKARQGKYLDYMRYFNEVCWAYPNTGDANANNQFERWVYEALIVKNNKAIETMLELTSYASKIVGSPIAAPKAAIDKMVMCLKGVGEE